VRARLRLHVVDATPDGPPAYLPASSWSESTLTSNPPPAWTGGREQSPGALKHR
jgi:hypothetical protein